MTLKLDKVNRGPHLSTLVASSISREIAQGRLKPGDQLPTEQALATTFGVSRNVVREAIARLRSEGRIWSQQGRGAFVADATNATVLTIDYETLQRAGSFRNLFELRGMLEVQIAALAATRRSDADIAAMEQALDGMRTAPYGSVAWLKNDLGFHRAVAEATQNPYMGQFLVFVSERVRESILAAGNQQKSDDMARTTLGEHERILAAIKAGDAKGASAAMTRHLAGAASRVGLPGGEVSAKPASPARHSRLRKAVRRRAAG
ncbi:FadR family transcriptional regulator [Mesorhizobium sp. WSM4303]|uniref:FadR/GntR family transcriptional regulator n=1 Tax=unclassified Mesorhizobium TaxID=325217 RepID=UPI00115F14FB|nr:MULTISPECIES: FadR/GntR family transcriptional regulator [unclassified Mesorhizobium]TRC98400.1 FadR family transcriptional regulator [Mesorhizobium sp. WSM4306]TRD04376.1 FadR family transcriptional regulator [Mesorhizobium sp. WSM4303]